MSFSGKVLFGFLNSYVALYKYLGIDEISIRKGKKDYACCLVDLEKASSWIFGKPPKRNHDNLFQGKRH